MASKTSNFTGTDGSNITTLGFTDGTDLVINSNHAKSSQATTYNFYRGGAADTVDQDIQALFAMSSSGQTTPWVGGRITSTGDGYFCEHSSGTWFFELRSGGSITDLGSYTGDSPTTPRTGKVALRNATKKFYIDTVERISSTDNTITGAGQFGIGTYYSDTATGCYLDDYSAQDASSGPVTHSCSGSLAGSSGVVSGSAAHHAKHTASGAVVGSAGVVSGTAVHHTKHTASGSLIGSAGAVVGSARRWRAHSASGSLVGSAGLIAGTSAHHTLHSASGVLEGSAGVISGSAAHTVGGHFSASGDLVGSSGVIAGTATHYTLHTASGDLVGSSGVINGISVGPEVVRQTGGDDARHTGWDKKAWKKRQKQEQALEETIRKTYLKTQGIEPTPEVIAEVVEEVKETAPEVAKPESFDYSGVMEWLQAQESIVSRIIARQQEEDDEEALLLLL